MDPRLRLSDEARIDGQREAAYYEAGLRHHRRLRRELRQGRDEEKQQIPAELIQHSKIADQIEESEENKIQKQYHHRHHHRRHRRQQQQQQQQHLSRLQTQTLPVQNKVNSQSSNSNNYLSPPIAANAANERLTILMEPDANYRLNNNNNINNRPTDQTRWRAPLVREQENLSPASGDYLANNVIQQRQNQERGQHESFGTDQQHLVFVGAGSVLLLLILLVAYKCLAWHRKQRTKRRHSDLDCDTSTATDDKWQMPLLYMASDCMGCARASADGISSGRQGENLVRKTKQQVETSTGESLLACETKDLEAADCLSVRFVRGRGEVEQYNSIDRLQEVADDGHVVRIATDTSSSLKKRLAESSLVVAATKSAKPKVRLIKSKLRRFIDDEAHEINARNHSSEGKAMAGSFWGQKLLDYLPASMRSQARERPGKESPESTPELREIAGQVIEMNEVVVRETNQLLVPSSQVSNSAQQPDDCARSKLTPSSVNNDAHSSISNCSLFSNESPPIEPMRSQLEQQPQHLCGCNGGPPLVGHLGAGQLEAGEFSRSKSQGHASPYSQQALDDRTSCLGRQCCASASPTNYPAGAQAYHSPANAKPSYMNHQAPYQKPAQCIDIPVNHCQLPAHICSAAGQEALSQHRDYMDNSSSSNGIMMAPRKYLPMSLAQADYVSKCNTGGGSSSNRIKHQYENYYDEEQSDVYRRLTASIGLQFGLGFPTDQVVMANHHNAANGASMMENYLTSCNAHQEELYPNGGNLQLQHEIPYANNGAASCKCCAQKDYAIHSRPFVGDSRCRNPLCACQPQHQHQQPAASLAHCELAPVLQQPAPQKGAPLAILVQQPSQATPPPPPAQQLRVGSSASAELPANCEAPQCSPALSDCVDTAGELQRLSAGLSEADRLRRPSRVGDEDSQRLALNSRSSNEDQSSPNHQAPQPVSVKTSPTNLARWKHRRRFSQRCPEALNQAAGELVTRACLRRMSVAGDQVASHHNPPLQHAPYGYLHSPAGPPSCAPAELMAAPHGLHHRASIGSSEPNWQHPQQLAQSNSVRLPVKQSAHGLGLLSHQHTEPALLLSSSPRPSEASICYSSETNANHCMYSPGKSNYGGSSGGSSSGIGFSGSACTNTPTSAFPCSSFATSHHPSEHQCNYGHHPHHAHHHPAYHQFCPCMSMHSSHFVTPDSCPANAAAACQSRKYSLPVQLESQAADRLSPSNRSKLLFEKNLQRVDSANLSSMASQQANSSLRANNHNQNQLVGMHANESVQPRGNQTQSVAHQTDLHRQTLESQRGSQTITRQSSFWLEDNTADSIMSLTQPSEDSFRTDFPDDDDDMELALNYCNAQVEQQQKARPSLGSIVLSGDSIESVKQRPLPVCESAPALSPDQPALAANLAAEQSADSKSISSSGSSKSSASSGAAHLRRASASSSAKPKGRLSSSSASSTTSSPSPEFGPRPSERILALAPKSSSISKRHLFSKLRARRHARHLPGKGAAESGDQSTSDKLGALQSADPRAAQTKATNEPKSSTAKERASTSVTPTNDSSREQRSSEDELAYVDRNFNSLQVSEQPANDNQVNSASLERQCRDLWKLRATLHDNSCGPDDWSNYHQRLNRRHDSGYKSIENQLSSSIEGNNAGVAVVTTTSNSTDHQRDVSHRADEEDRPPSGCSGELTRPLLAESEGNSKANSGEESEN